MWTVAGNAFTVCWVWGLLSQVSAGAEVTVVGEVNGSVILSCNHLSESVENMMWFKAGIPTSILSTGDLRLSLVNKSSLQINELCLKDEGNYTCREDQAATGHDPQVQLLIASGPHSINASISPTRSLPNGTLVVTKGSKLDFSCTSQSQPMPLMKWVVKTESTDSAETFSEENRTSISFSINNIAADYTGNYSCTAQNLLSGRKQTTSLQVLVYYPPKSDPVCWADNLPEESAVHLICKWPGGFPASHLQWIEDHRGFKPIVNTTGVTDYAMVKLNKPLLRDRQRFKCLGSHVTREEREKAACTVQILLPLLESQPLRTCFVGENVTLACKVSSANPPVQVIRWLRNSSQTEEEIQSGLKYEIVQNTSVSFLTIRNCSQDTDGGYFICKAENAISVKELNIWLTVIKPSNIVGLVVGLVLLFLLVVGLVTAAILYNNPQLYPKGNIFGRPGAMDMLVLVDSENEEEMEEMATAEDLDMTDTVREENGIISHKALYHSAPKGYSTELQSDVSVEEERSMPDI
ncbi:V-set and immunoglobulin domain-containing protein 10 [Microcaecilia unicolor]|uniref:V-set and immunoglobulin domain-containing protein 10 n=1 Tax=Microcaecilia unicolor TaxID=1415580 RepID=UPI0011867B5B|nr:V-set and immunoglobulin domain-containing protein 10 [Microcaecilia unicolor]